MIAFTEPDEFSGLCDHCLNWSQKLLGFFFGAARKNFCRTCRGWMRTVEAARKIRAQLVADKSCEPIGDHT